MQQSDSTRVEVRTETVYKTDTAYVELPVIVERVVTLDTTSTLENAYARSSASVEGNILHHSLETKQISLPVEVKVETVYRDSLVYRDRTELQTVEVEKSLSGWQQFRLNMGTAFLLLIVVATLYLFLHFIYLKH